ncbi:MAG TPA: DUF2795 domain-containing protein [Ktedonobacteraceae bacterium]|nr:DUF2795 domain-containing protein [Ktedonobacteraceae bacterium]
MSFDPAAMANQVLNALPYPISKDNLVQMARQYGANDQIVSMLERLPDKTYNSPQEIQGDLGNLGGLGGLFNR